MIRRSGDFAGRSVESDGASHACVAMLHPRQRLMPTRSMTCERAANLTK